MSASKGALASFLFMVGGIIVILYAPDVALTVEVFLLPVEVALAIGAVFYLTAMFRRQPEPRSRFFRMMVTSQAYKVVLGVWVCYLVLGRIGERTGWFSFETPDPTVSSPLSGWLLIIVLAIPIAYALEVARLRASAKQGGTSQEPHAIELTEDRPATRFERD